MFGIGLPEMILIMALALIVVGPDKLPDLARSLAKGIMELKKTAEGLKDSFAEEGNPLDDIRPDLEEAAKSLKNNLLEGSSLDFDELSGGVNPPADTEAEPYTEVIEKDDNLSPNDDAASVSDAGEQPDQPIIDIEVDDLDGNSETKVQS
jgi:sec-independent protein translocase protein TatB